METFSALLALCEGNPPVTRALPSQRPVMRIFHAFFNEQNFIPAWMSSHLPSEVCGEIIYPFPNFNGCTVEIWKWINILIMGVIMYPGRD